MHGDSEIAAGLPTLAVLPFHAEGGDDSVALIAEGLTEDICGALTRFRALRVIAPASASRLRAATDAEIGARLRASHVLRGRLRAKADGRLRLNADLASARSGEHLWSERFALPRGDPSEVGEAVVARIAATLNARIEEAALADARRRPAAGLEAWELTLRGVIMIRQGTRESDAAARALFERAIALDPLHARAHAGLALSWFNEWSCQFWDRFEEASRRAYAHARRALELDDRDGMIHLIIAKVALFRAEWEQAAWYVDRALMLGPHDADLLVTAAILDVHLGRPEAAVRHVERAMALDPLHPNFYYMIGAFARVFLGDYEEAVALAARSDAVPFVDISAYLAAAHAMLGRTEAAQAEFARFVAEYGARIAFGAPFPHEAPLDWMFAVNQFRRAEDVAMLREAFRRIGAAATAPTAPKAAAPARPDAPRLARSGEGWIADYDGAQAVLPDLKGLHDLRRLLERPGEEIHCLDLDERIVETPGGATLDERARSALKARLRDLQEELAEAEDRCDLGRAEKLREEMDAILATLSAALGLGGRDRRLGDSAEKARTAVTWRIRHALRKVEAAHPGLGRFLSQRVETGTFCRFRPS